jgi:hypothetical protein
MSCSFARDGRLHKWAPLLLLAAVALALPSSAGAATVFGADMAQAPGFTSSDLSITNVLGPGGATDNGTPVGGILTSVRIKTASASGDGTIRVLTLTSHPDATTYNFLNSGPAIPVHIVGTTSHVTQVLTRRPIAAGQRLGWFTNDSAGAMNEMYNDFTNQPECAFSTSLSHPGGTVLDYRTVGCNHNLLLASGTVEADADGDGYGDDTQDLCPTDGSKHAACTAVATPPLAAPAAPATPTPSTTPKIKCKQKKHRRAAAVAKKKCKKKHHR